MKKFDHQKIEKKWVKAWDASGIYTASDTSAKPKYYALVEFPYPSGVGLHVGHIRSNTALDIIARKRRMQGYNVLFPMGWDAFGLPTENYAIKTGIAPQVATKKNTATFKKQLKTLGFSFDWSREIDTTDPKYYQWTQWMFLQFFKHGLAYKDKAEINWCPKDKIGLANEEVEGGKCERCGGPVEKRLKEQWMLKMSSYSEKLLSGLKGLDFIPEVATSQENWIGKSEGVEIEFPIAENIKRFVLLHGKGGSPHSNSFPWLKKVLEARGYEVQVPELPNTNEPSDEEQADFVQKNCTFDDNTALLGHSFGGIVALRLLERGIKVHKLVLVATPFSDNFLDGKLRPTVSVAVKKGFNVPLIKKNTDIITLLFDTHDAVVSLADGESFADLFGCQLRKVQATSPHFTGSNEVSILSALIPAIKVFTTRPDTIFGATYLVVAPEHPALVRAIADNYSFLQNKTEVRQYMEATRNKNDLERSAENREKTGIELKGLRVINPATKEEIPVWTSDYVLGGYGTGAIMAVPQHDERDRAFAEKFKLPIVDKPLVSIEEALKISGGTKKIQYKLRDWVFSRQRYWGEPIPLVYCEKDSWVSVPEDKLPVKLPKVEKYQPTDNGESPLSKIDSWVNVKCPTCKGPAKRETDTMPNWAGSSWYYLAYVMSKKAFDVPVSNENWKLEIGNFRKWLPVDWYNGGMEHATRHLLYARFWNQFLHDIGEVPVSEPFHKRTAHGIILGADGTKMSKSVGNVVNPDELVKEFGADALRMYEMFIGPFNQMVSWDPRGILGASRFLEKVWRTAQSKNENKNERLLHKTIKKVSEDIEKMSFNTAVSAMMVFLNEADAVPEEFIKLLAPFAPFLAEELWAELGYKESIHLAPWPEFDPKLLVEETFDLVVQINGRVRAKIPAQRGISGAEAQALAVGSPEVKKWVIGDIKKVIFIENRLINLIV